MKYATGYYYKSVAKTKERDILLEERKQIYLKWWQNDPKHKDAVTSYQDKHLKDIISRFGFMFTKETDLNLVGDELRQCLLMSNAISPDVVNHSVQITFSPIRRSNRKHNQPISEKRSSEHSLPYKRESNDKTIIPNIFLQDSNKTNSLSQPNEISSIYFASEENKSASSDDDKNDWLPPIKIFLQNFDNSITDLEELAKIEYALSYIHSNHVLHSVALQYSLVVEEPNTITFTKLQSLSNNQRGNLVKRIHNFREKYFESNYSLYSINKTQLLIDWINQGKRVSKGENLPPNNTETNPSNGLLWMSNRAMSYIRHIICAFKVPRTRFPSMMNCFSVLLLGKAMNMDDFSSISTITRRMQRLDVFDSYYFGNIFKQKVTKLSKFGFPILVYFMTDDTKMHENLHAIIRTAIDKDNNKCFRLYSTSGSASKIVLETQKRILMN